MEEGVSLRCGAFDVGCFDDNERMMLPRVCTLFVLFLLPAAALAVEIERVADVQIVARLTGSGAINPTADVAVGGTDLGHMVHLGGKTYFLFGDSFSGESSVQGGDWRNNLMAFSSDENPSDGITFDGWITDADGKARQVIRSQRIKAFTEIPSGAIDVGDRIYAWYMAVKEWGLPGRWTAHYSGLAYWEEGDEAFTIVEGFEFPGDSNFGMVAASYRTDPAGKDDKHIYLWGTPAGRFAGVKLARFDPAQIENVKAYEYFAGMKEGQPTWTDEETDSPIVVPGPVGEMSVMYNPALESWTLMTLNHSRQEIVIYQSPEPWGLWSKPVVVTTGRKFPGLYAPYMNPKFVEDDGRTIYFTMSLWWSYDVYLMKARLETRE